MEVQSEIQRSNEFFKFNVYRILVFIMMIILIFNICIGIFKIKSGEYIIFNDICIVKSIDNNTIICDYKNCTYELQVHQPFIGQKLQGSIKCDNRLDYNSGIILLSLSIFLLVNCIIIQFFLFFHSD